MNGMIVFIIYNYFSKIIQKISMRKKPTVINLPPFFPFCDDNSLLYTWKVEFYTLHLRYERKENLHKKYFKKMKFVIKYLFTAFIQEPFVLRYAVFSGELSARPSNIFKNNKQGLPPVLPQLEMYDIWTLYKFKVYKVLIWRTDYTSVQKELPLEY